MPALRGTPCSARYNPSRPVLIVPLLAGLGLASAVALVGWVGFGRVGGALVRVGWAGFAAFAASSLPLYAVLGLAWFAPAEPRSFRSALAFGAARIAREAAAELLPFSTLGGYLVGARAAALLGVGAAVAFGTGAVDLVTETLSKFAYLALGAAAALGRERGNVSAHGGRCSRPQSSCSGLTGQASWLPSGEGWGRSPAASRALCRRRPEASPPPPG